MSENDLAQAFGVLLRRPLADFPTDAAYALYYSDDIVSTEFFDEDLDLGLLARGEIAPLPDFAVPSARMVDLGRSMFTIEMDVPQFHRPRRGTKVAKVLAAEGLSAADLEDEWITVDLRVHTDGTLFDAMRAATGTDHLLPFAPDGDGLTVQPKWERRLTAVTDPALRDHLRMFCLDAHSARGAGAHYVADRHPGFAWMPEKGYRMIAAWKFGEGQATSAIARRSRGRSVRSGDR